MVITELRQTAPERFIVKFDNGAALSTTLSAVADLGLFLGMELTDEEFRRVKAASALALCKSRALHIIGARAMSKKELYDKLVNKGELPENAEDAVRWLEELGLLDDEAYAGMIVRHYAARGYGKRRVQSELYRRGLSRDLWASALEEMPEQDDKLDSLLSRKLKSREPDRSELKKATDALIRRGFSWDEINAAVERFQNEAEISERNDHHYD